jgi:menaquinone-dependent protoporphyrinogen oxidase
MKETILVTYASRTGTTAGVADAIGKTLLDSGLNVNILPMKEVRDIEQYRSVIAGSAIQASAWLPEAVEFIEINREILSRKPFVIFTVCMTMAMKGADKYRQGVQDWIEPVRKIVKPVKEGLFAGRLRIKDIKSAGDRIKFRISVWTGVWKEGDHRNWDEIKKWTESLKEVL